MAIIFDSLQLKKAVDLMAELSAVAHGSIKKMDVELKGSRLIFMAHKNKNEWQTAFDVETLPMSEDLAEWRVSISIVTLRDIADRLAGPVRLDFEDGQLKLKGIHVPVSFSVPAVSDSVTPADRWTDWQLIATHKEKTGFDFKRLADLATWTGKKQDYYNGIWFDFTDPVVKLVATDGMLLNIQKTELATELVDDWIKKQEITRYFKEWHAEALFFGRLTTRIFRALSWLSLNNFYLGKTVAGVPGFRFDAKISNIDFIFKGNFEQVSSVVPWRYLERSGHVLLILFGCFRELVALIKNYPSDKITLSELLDLVNNTRRRNSITPDAERLARRMFTDGHYLNKKEFLRVLKTWQNVTTGGVSISAGFNENILSLEVFDGKDHRFLIVPSWEENNG